MSRLVSGGYSKGPCGGPLIFLLYSVETENRVDFFFFRSYQIISDLRFMSREHALVEGRAVFVSANDLPTCNAFHISIAL